MRSSRRRAAVATACVLGLAFVVFALTRGGGGTARRSASTPGIAKPPAPSAPPAPSTSPAAPAQGPEPKLALGLDEKEPALLSAPTAARTPAGFSPARAALNALHPRYVRIVVNWGRIQPTAGRTANLSQAEDGCVRGSLCAPYGGLLAELQAIRSRQQAGEHVDPVIVLAYAPAWAALPAGGCERPGAGPASRPLSPRGFAAYQTLIRQILALGRGAGVSLPYWSPWNEPNHPTFVTQRKVCQSSAPAISPQTYAALVQAMQHALGGSPHRLIVGELAGFHRSLPTETSVAEFIAALPSAVLCQGSIFAVHDYFGSGGRSLAASTAAVSSAESALARKGSCGAGIELWVTESGAGSTRRTVQSAANRERACLAFAGALGQWYRDPRVRAVFQYTFREDPLFPIGLYSNALTQRFPSYRLLHSWAQNQRQSPSSGACHG